MQYVTYSGVACEGAYEEARVECSGTAVSADGWFATTVVLDETAENRVAVGYTGQWMIIGIGGDENAGQPSLDVYGHVSGVLEGSVTVTVGDGEGTTCAVEGWTAQ